MAKKSCKRPARLKKDNAGCMSGLISIFNFQQGRFTRRLLSDKNLGSARHGGTVHSKNKFDVLSNLEEMHEDVSDADDVERVNSSKASIKALMAEEMSMAPTSNKIPSSIVEQRVEMYVGANNEKNQMKTNKNCRAASPSTWLDPSECSAFDVNLVELMVEFCRENHECQEKQIESNGDLQLTQNHYILQKALSDITEALLAQKSVDSKQITTNGYFDAIERLNLNKDIFLKLLRDPDSLLFKHVQDPQNARNHGIFNGSKHEELSHKQNRHHFFRKKDKSDGAHPKNDSTSQDLKRIVVLKPSPNTINAISSPKLLHDLKHQEGTEKVSSQFSIKEIKRRLRNMIGESKKEQDLIAMDGILHKIPYGNNKASKFSTFLKKGDKDVNLIQLGSQKKTNRLIASHPLDKESVFSEEAKKRLAEMLGLVAQNEVSSPIQVSKSLGRILSLPGHGSLSPRFTPAIDKEVILRIKQDDSTFNRSSVLSIGNLPCNENNSDDGSPSINSDPSLLETQLHVGEDSIKKGSLSPRFRPAIDKEVIRRIKQDDSTFNRSSALSIGNLPCNENNSDDGSPSINSDPSLLETQLHVGEDSIKKESSKTEERGNLDVPVESSTDELGCISEICNEKESSAISVEGASEEALPMTPSISVSKSEDSESTIDKLDRPSPVSVLEPLFSEDTNSSERTKIDHAKLEAEPQHLRFKEECDDSPLVLTPTKIEYVRTVLEESGLNYNKHPERLQSSDQLLDTFVYDEAEILYRHLIDDSKLLFDCINEVLIEMKERYLSCTPWISFIKPSIRPLPTGETFGHEVCKGVDKHLHIVFPYTLDMVTRKDLECGTWVNVWMESEGAVAEIGEVILEYIMEETILELWE